MYVCVAFQQLYWTDGGKSETQAIVGKFIDMSQWDMTDTFET